MLPINKTISIIERSNILFRNEAFKHMNLRGYQASYLLEITRHPGISQEELTRNMHIDKSNVARGLMHLSELGYIERVQDENDMRVLRLYPNEKGKVLAIEIKRILHKQRDYILQDFSDEELVKFLQYLERLKERALSLAENATIAGHGDVL